MVIECIYFDAEFFAIMLKLEQFFFKHFAKYCKVLPVADTVCAVTSTSTVTITASTSSSSISGQ